MSTHMDRYRGFIEKSMASADAWVDVPITEFSEDICRLMEEQGVSRAELARRLGSSRAYVTKLLGGNANFTLQTMTKVAMVLGGAVHIHVAPRNATVHWRDEPDSQDSQETAAAAELSGSHKASRRSESRVK